MPTKQFVQDSVYFRRVAGKTLTYLECLRFTKNAGHAYITWLCFANKHNGLNRKLVADMISELVDGQVVRVSGADYGAADGTAIISSTTLFYTKTKSAATCARHWVTLLWEMGYLEALPDGFECHCGEGEDCEEDSEAEEEPLPPPPKAEEVLVPRTGHTFRKAKPAAPRAPEGGVVPADHPLLLDAMAAARRALAACDAALAKAK